jgi:hypothetical protein
MIAGLSGMFVRNERHPKSKTRDERQRNYDITKSWVPRNDGLKATWRGLHRAMVLWHACCEGCPGCHHYSILQMRQRPRRSRATSNYIQKTIPFQTTLFHPYLGFLV